MSDGLLCIVVTFLLSSLSRAIASKDIHASKDETRGNSAPDLVKDEINLG